MQFLATLFSGYFSYFRYTQKECLKNNAGDAT